jgi:hypothetical protein
MDVAKISLEKNVAEVVSISVRVFNTNAKNMTKN